MERLTIMVIRQEHDETAETAEVAPESPRAARARRWLEEHGDALYAYARSRLRDDHRAEELVQETLLAAMESIDSFEQRSSERTWLIGILRNKLLQSLEKLGREFPRPEPNAFRDHVDGQFNRAGKWIVLPRRWRSDPTQLPQDAEFWRVLERCLDFLPPRNAAAFMLCERQELSAEQIAASMGTSPGAVWTMLYRARVSLRRCLEEHWFGEAQHRDDSKHARDES